MRSLPGKTAAKARRLLILLPVAVLIGCSMPGAKDADETAGWSANKLYTEAKDALNGSAYDKAIKLYEKLEARYPYGRYAQQAQIEIAYAYFKSGDAAAAVAACDRFIKLHPNHQNVDYVYYLKGLVNFNEDLGYLGYVANQDLSERDPKGAREAFDAFKELVARYPDSKYAPDATARMKYLLNALAMNEVHVARYYMKRGAWVAAINRAQSVLKNFPGTPATEEALYTMKRSYDALGLTDLRDDTDRVLRKNFPNSAFLNASVQVQKEKSWWQLW